MARVGILMHVRHLETVGLEKLVWGVPEEDSLGSLTKVVELILQESSGEPIGMILFGGGPSEKDGLCEGQYLKKYLLDHLDEITKFPRFSGAVTPDVLRKLEERVKNIVVTEKFERSMNEVAIAAERFKDSGITKVYQVTAASHAPRCVQIQCAARVQGLIPKEQQWFLVADDRCYEGTDPFSTAVFESPHRGDDPMYGFHPTFPEVMKQYQYGLSGDDKKKLILLIDEFMRQHATENDIRQFGSRSNGNIKVKN